MRLTQYLVCVLLLAVLPLGLLAENTVQSSPEPVPAAIVSFIEGLNAKSYGIARNAFSKEFTLPGLPPEMKDRMLSEVFKSMPGSITNYAVKSSSLSGKYTTYVISSTFNGKDKDLEFQLDKKGKITFTSLFSVQGGDITSSKSFALVSAATIPFETENELILVEAKLNGKPAKFILDSGAPALMLNAIPEQDTTRTIVASASGVAGSVNNMGLTRVQSFSWGGGTARDVEVPTMDLSMRIEGKQALDIAGLIGQSLLEPYEVHIDYAKKLIYLYQLNKDGTLALPTELPTPKQKISFSLAAHIPLIKTSIGKQKYMLGLDTGAQANVLDSKYQKDVAGMFETTETDTMIGVEQIPVIITTAQISDTKIGKLKFPGMRYAFTDLSHINQMVDGKLDGLLGVPFLSQRRISINYRTRILAIY